ncbi:flagellar hook-length control protein FliK [Neptuniibacter sp.]|uniref:flagellar hook-length control protein FliK n=1 Tax=Neptuniibacter sp. TaxID=1962643 RepID=UPI003B59C553
MSQQLSIPAGNGLLSINLQTLPQTGAMPSEGGVPVFTGFSSMMSDAVSEKGVPGGAFLPPQGVSLPQEAVQQLNLDSEQLKERLMHLAEMLGQQSETRAEGDGLSAEVMAELGKALRSFAEGEIPELPDELRQKLEEARAVSAELMDVEEGVDQVVAPVIDDVTDEPVTDVLSTEQLVSEELIDQADPELKDKNVEEPVSLPEQELVAEGSDEEVADDLIVADLDEEAVDEVVQSFDSVEVVESLDSLEGDEQVGSDGQVNADEVVSATQVSPEVDVAAPESETDEEVVAVAVNDPRRSPVAEAARQDFNAEAFKNKGEYVSQVARSQNQSGNNAPAVNVANATSGSDADADLVQQNRVGQQVNVDARPVERELQRSAPKVDPQLAANTAQSETASKPSENPQVRPVASSFSLDKFESMLEASQKLMTKATAGAEKLGDSPFSSRLESASSSANVVPQSVSQPTQVQKAVTEANNLMMPQNVKLNTPAWSSALAERAVMVAAQNANVAQIQLDPPELGSLNIRVQINQDQVSLNFTSPHAHVRDAVEQSLPRLREMFAEQGLALNESSVSDQQSGGASKEEMAGEGQGGEGGYLGQTVEDDIIEGSAAARNMSLVDYYA